MPQIKIEVVATGTTEAANALKALGDAGLQATRVVAKGSSEAAGALKSLGDSARHTFEIFTGVNLANMFQQAVGAIKGFAVESVKLGLEARRQEEAFKALTQAAGVNGEALIANLERVTAEIIDSGDAMDAAGRALLAGLQPDQIVKVMEIARAQSKLFGTSIVETFNTITVAISTGQTRALKQLGVDADAAYTQYAASIGKTTAQLTQQDKTLALYQATVAATQNSVKALTADQITQAEQVQKLAKDWENFHEAVGQFLLDIGLGLVQWFRDLIAEMGDLGPTLKDIGAIWKAVWEAALVALGPLVPFLKKEIIETVKLVGAAFVALGVVLVATMAGLAGPVAFLASLFDDLSNKRMPSLSKAGAEFARATAEGQKQIDIATAAMGRLSQGFDQTTGAAKALPSEMGKSSLAVKQVGEAAKGSADEMDKVSQAIRGLTDQLGQAVLAGLDPIAGEQQKIVDGFRKMLAGIKDLGPEAFASLMKWAEGQAALIVRQKQINEGLAEFRKIREELLNRPMEVPKETQDLAKVVDAWTGAMAKANAETLKGGDALVILQDQVKATVEALAILEGQFSDQVGIITTVSEKLGILVPLLAQLSIAKEQADTFRDFDTAMTKVHDTADLLGQSLGTRLAGLIAATEANILKTALAFGKWSPQVKQLQADLAGLQAQAFDEEIASIGRQVELLGPAFNSTEALIAALTKRMMQLAAEAKGITPEVLALKNQISALKGPLVEAAEAMDRTFRDRQRDIDALNTLTSAQERFFQQGLEGWAAQSRAMGDYTSTFQAEFTIALTRGKDFYSNLRELASGLAGDLSSAFKTFFTDFAGQVQQGKSVWESFTSALKSLWNNLMNSLLKRFVDFLVDMALQAAAKKGAGSALDWVVSLFGSGAAAGSSGAFNPATGGGGTGLSAGADFGGTSIAGGGGTGLSAGADFGDTGGSSAASTAIGGASGLVTAVGVGSGVRTIASAPSLGAGMSNLWTNLTTPISGGMAVLAGVGTALGIAMIAMRDDITDLGKAVQSAILAAGFVASFWLGPIASLAAVAINMLIDWSGIFKKGSERWLTFSTRLSGTLEGEAKAFEGFGKELQKASNLTGVAKSIEKFRHDIEAAGVGGFFEATKGRGLFGIPGIPGATGTKHEGGLAIDFGPFINDAQNAINTVLAGVRNTISVEFTDMARKALPPDVADAFVGGLGKLRAEFERLVASPDATIEELEEFEKVLAGLAETLGLITQASKGVTTLEKSIGKLLPADIASGFLETTDLIQARILELAASGTATAEDIQPLVDAIAALGEMAKIMGASAKLLTEIGETARRVLPNDIAGLVTANAAKLRKELVDLANSGNMTGAEVAELANRIAELGKLVEPMGAAAEALKQISASAGDILPADLADPVIASAAALRDELVKLATSGDTTAEELADLTERIAALASQVVLYDRLATEIASLSGDLDTMTARAIVNTRVRLQAADRAVDEAMENIQEALTAPEFAAAAVALEKAILDRYALERQLIAEIEATINDILQTFGPSLMRNAMRAVGNALEHTNIAPLLGMIGALEGIQRSATSASAKLWAATAAIQAIAASIPGLVRGFQSQITDPSAFAQSILDAALPSLTTIANMYGQALGAGDITGALNLLGQGSDLILQLADAAIAGVRQWEAAAVAAAEKAAAAQIDAVTKAAQAQIDAINKTAEADIERINTDAENAIKANDLRIEALNKERETIEKMIDLSREWANVVEDIDKFISDLMTGGATPLNPAEAFRFAQQQYQAAQAAFTANPTPANAAAVQQAAQTMLQAFQIMRPAGRPSPEYEALVNKTVAELKAIQAYAAAQVTPEEESARRLASIDAEIQRLTDLNESIRDAADEQIKAIETARDSQITAIEKARDEQIKAIEQARDAYIAGVHEAAEYAVIQINAAVADIMGKIAAEQFRLMGLQVKAQEEMLRAITNGLDPQSFLVVAAARTATALENLRDIVHASLTEGTIPGVTPVPTVTPGSGGSGDQGSGGGSGGTSEDKDKEDTGPRTMGLARGGIVTKPMYALIGEAGPEVVRPLADDRAGSTTLTIDSVTIVVGDRENPRQAGREAAQAFERRLIELIRAKPNVRHALRMFLRDGL